MNLLSPALHSAIGWTLIHFVWQGALLACAIALALVALRNARPQLRYTLCCTALLLCVLWPAVELCSRLSSGDALGADVGVTARIMMPERTAQPLDLLGWLQLQLCWIVAFWAACAAALALRMLAGLVWIDRLSGGKATNAALQERLSALAVRLGVDRAVRLVVVDSLPSPVTAGWWRPVVLVPASLLSGMPPELLEALLAHEMAHVKRLDYLVNLAQNVVEIMLFYHPAVWWISGRIRVERELIADDIAANVLGEPRRLALALSELERLQFASPHLALAANGGELMSRITRLVRPGRHTLGWTAALPLLGMAAACLSLYANAQAPVAGKVTLEKAAGDIVDGSCSAPAPAANFHGAVGLVYLVEADGRQQDSRITASSGNARLDRAVQTYFSSCRITPNSTGGVAQRGWVALRYAGKLDVQAQTVPTQRATGTAGTSPAPLLTAKSEQVRMTLATKPDLKRELKPETTMETKSETRPVQSEADEVPPIAKDTPLLAPAPVAPIRIAAVADFSTCARPEYPKEARRYEHTGRVTLGFLISKGGTVVDAKVIKSSGYAELDGAALTGISKCRFRPASENGVPAEAWMQMQYVWVLGPARQEKPADTAAPL
ncbi:MAG: TonB family protein [Massilia sp.]